MRVVTFKIDEELLIQLDNFAVSHGLTRSDVIRMAIKWFLTQDPPRSRVKIRIRKVVLV